MTIAEFMEYAKQFGIAGIFAAAWWMERSDKKAAEVELREVTREAVAAITEIKSAVANLVSVFKGRD